MNHRTAHLFLATVLATLAIPAAEAADIKISGRITNTACSLSVDSVLMGDVPITEFASSSTPSTAYHKSLVVRLGGCTLSTLNSAALKFSGTSVSGSPTILKLSAGTNTATGFGVQIQTNDLAHAQTTKTVRFDGAETYPFNVDSNTPSFTFKAYYIKLPGVTSIKSGDANATATVTLIYS